MKREPPLLPLFLLLFIYFSAPHIEMCGLLLSDDGQRGKGPSLHRLFRARSTASGM